MSDSIDVYKLNWGSASIGTPPLSDGLWINHDRIAIHWSTFCQNYLHTSDYPLKREHLTQFYISYDDDDDDDDDDDNDHDIVVELMHFTAYRLNDLLFQERPYRGLKRAKVFTTIEC